jgi:hypothetical protein
MQPLHFIRRLGVIAAAALGIAGCARAQDIDDRADAKIDAIHQEDYRAMMRPTCENGAPILPRCGLIVDRVAMPDFQQTFVEKKCAGDTEEQCDAKLDTSIETWLVERYPLAALREIEVACNQTPRWCDDPRERELMMLDSHNSRQREIYVNREADVESEREMQHAVARENTERAAFIALLAVDIVAHRAHHRPHR